MENGDSTRNVGPVAAALLPATTGYFRKNGQVGIASVLDSGVPLRTADTRQTSEPSGVQLVCTNPGCTVTSWVESEDWEARVASVRRRRGWNGDEDDHDGRRQELTRRAESPASTDQLACPCGRGWRRRSTMPSTASPAAVAARLERLQQQRMIRRSEPMLAVGAAGNTAGAACQQNWLMWPFAPAGCLNHADTQASNGWDRPAPAINHHHSNYSGLTSHVVGAERLRTDSPVAFSRHRVLSQPETYDSARGSGELVYNAGNVPHSFLPQPPNGYKLPLIAPNLSGPSPATDYQQSNTSHHLAANYGDMMTHPRVTLKHQELGGRQRDLTGPGSRHPSSDGAPVFSNSSGRQRTDSRGVSNVRRDGASPDSISSDSGVSAASNDSAPARRKPSNSSVGGTTTVSKTYSRGNIFRQRTPAELAAFKSLSLHCNAYEVQTAGDDAPYGKDRLRTHVLVALSAARRSTVDCVVCAAELTVYHDFPLLDGLFFESPIRYNSDVRVEPVTVGGLHRQPLNDASKFYLNAVCLKCLQGRGDSRLECRSCHSAWNGSLFVVGNVYLYDIFAALICCTERLQCRRCGQPACGTTEAARPVYYSDGSRQVRCQHCRALDHHYVKLVDDVFTRVAVTTKNQPAT